MKNLIDEFGYIDLGDSEVIHEDDFKERFGTELNYQRLIKHEQCTPRWKDIFVNWKELGILN